MKLLRKLAKITGPYFYNYINYIYLHLKRGQIPKPLNLATPKTFNEKLIYLKLNYRHPNAHIYADKLAVREYVKNKVGDEYLIPIIKVYDQPDDIKFEELPKQFVLKLNHGSGMNIICKDKSKLDKITALKNLEKWYSQNYYEVGGEYQYSDITTKVFAERYMETKSGSGDLNDYKIFCFDGVPKFVQVDVDRFDNHKRAFYDLKWNRLPFTILHPNYEGEVEKPERLIKMLEIARSLSKGFPHIRVDLYTVEGKIYFGELTFHHGGGFEPFFPQKFNRKIGDYLRLPDEINN